MCYGVVVCELDEISPQSAIFSPGALSNAVTIYPVHIAASEHEQNREVHNTVKLSLQSSSVLFFKVTNRDVQCTLYTSNSMISGTMQCSVKCAENSVRGSVFSTCIHVLYTVYSVQRVECEE